VSWQACSTEAGRSKLSFSIGMVFEEGAKVPDGVNDLPMCVPVASQLLHAAGIGNGDEHSARKRKSF